MEIMKKLFLLIALLASNAFAGEFGVMAGAWFSRPPDTGTYWNNNQSYVNNMTPASFGFRYDSDISANGWSYAVQYTDFGTVTMDAMAVSHDVVDPDGYNPATGTCAITCAPSYRWVMKTKTQSVALIGTKHWGKWSLEGGLNLYETKTSGDVITPTFVFHYPGADYMYIMPMLGAAYQFDKNWSLHSQVWWMTAPGDVPAAFTSDATATVHLKYNF
jgi:hypothetical protein